MLREHRRGNIQKWVIQIISPVVLVAGGRNHIPYNKNKYCESTVIPWHQFLWFLQNAVILGFSNTWFQKLQETVTGKIVFRWILYSWFK